MTAFFQRAQEDLAAVFVRHQQAQRIDVEGARGREVTDHQLDMAQPDRVERRVEVKLR